jgi:intracellular sulfur oxidation DsrE/DsrF family protein
MNTPTRFSEEHAMDESLEASPARRSFLSRLGVVAAALGFGGSAAQAQSAAPKVPWQPGRHAEDDWLERLPGSHRMFFDTVMPPGVAQAIAFTNNYFTANKNGYGLESSDLAVVICLRHMATPFALTDAFWSKYAAPLAEFLKFNDPKTGEPATVNVRGAALDALHKRGVHFAVCDMSLHVFADMLARKTEGKAHDIYKEMAAGTIGNSHIVAAGIVAVNRAQERGYAIAYVG